MAQTYNKGKVSDMADPTCDDSGKEVKVIKSEDALEGRKLSWGKLRRIDSLNLEAGRVSNIQTHGAQIGWSRTLLLAFQSIGVVYGDIGTSPLYVYASTFTDGIKETEDLLGALSLILYTLILIPLLKYVLIVLWANDNGDGNIVVISIAILIMLFSIQRFGTDKVGYSFAPIIVIWFSFIGGIGLYNLIKYDLGVLRAFNPKYIIDYFKRNGKQGWVSLGGIVLAITGTEAMFADLGHFNVRAIQISFCFVLLPAVSLAYIGQAAYLTKFPEEVADTFYKSIPDPLFWPTFIVAVSAAIIASQAMISGAYAIISQSQALGCFPRVRVFHTSAKYEGQVYIPEINFALMIACVIVTASFRTTEKIGHAYGPMG
ncbi:hypothetical protein COCNU_15G006100 [Cocos nucifera]|uniref:K+ potassium transporter integral membrane domain-containing protein n=1 Tax=Cocos nucifera TaxID=13894 RepID=A0A8K0IXD1_COCNU|nr:hypothetical protein COCNU_15G006100 [Cocos nucifera]